MQRELERSTYKHTNSPLYRGNCKSQPTNTNTVRYAEATVKVNSQTHTQLVMQRELEKVNLQTHKQSVMRR